MQFQGYDTSLAKETIADNLYYHALFAEPDVPGEHLWVMLKERGICDAAESIWCSDGAKWIWRQKKLHDPPGKEIVDYIHACEYLQKVANSWSRHSQVQCMLVLYEDHIAKVCWQASA